MKKVRSELCKWYLAVKSSFFFSSDIYLSANKTVRYIIFLRQHQTIRWNVIIWNRKCLVIQFHSSQRRSIDPCYNNDRFKIFLIDSNTDPSGNALTFDSLVVALGEEEHRFGSPLGSFQETLAGGVLAERFQKEPVGLAHRREPVFPQRHLVVQLDVEVEWTMFMSWDGYNV